MTVSKLRVGVTRGDVFTLLRKTEAAVDTPRWLGTDGAVGGSASACDRSATPMKDRQCNVVLLRNFCDVLLPLI